MIYFLLYIILPEKNLTPSRKKIELTNQVLQYYMLTQDDNTSL